jgi:hypothetical protein
MIHLNWRGFDTKILNPTATEIIVLVVILVALVVAFGIVAPPTMLEVVRSFL